MKEKFKPLNFNSKNIFTALFATICLYILRLVLLGLFQSVIPNTVVAEVIVYTLFIIIVFILEKKKLFKQLKSFKSDVKGKILNVAIVSILLLLAEYFINMFIIKFFNINPAGQSNLYDLFKENVIMFLILSIITIPILETLVYYYPYNNIKNRKLAFIFSSTIFALFHIIIFNSPMEMLFLIPYFCMTLSFGYGMYKTNNIYMSMIIHAINNLIAVVLLLI